MVKDSLRRAFLFAPIVVNKEKLSEALEGKSILITGASSGIGEQVAYELAHINCHLILVARRKDRLVAIKREIEQHRAKVSIFQADLREKEEIGAFLSFLQQLPKGLDVVVSNAGLSINRSIYDSLDRYHDFTRTMAINYFAPVQLLLATIPSLQKNKGQIINVSTINTSLQPIPGWAAYQASKSAFDTWLRSVAPELAVNGITTTSIYLPLVRTPMILPTKAYQNVPAMSTEDAAIVICKAMYTKRKRYQPWWLIFGQLASIMFRSALEKVSKGAIRKRRKGR